MWYWIWFAAGIFVGTVFGLVTTCVVVAGKDLSDDEYEQK